MRRNCIVLLLSVFASAVSTSVANAQCTLPFQLTNGQTADATQVMANFNALVSCLANAGPAGSTNSVQYNAGAGLMGGVGPLTNGQLVIGSTGNAPQAQTLTAGSGISITNGAGNVTIAATGVGGSGLYRQVMSATPTSAGTGLTTWLNQGSATVTDSAVGVAIDAPSVGASSLTGRYMTAPTPPYTIRTLIGATRTSTNYASASFGWYDGTSKLHLISYTTYNGGAPFFEVIKWNSVTSYNGADLNSPINAFSQPIWLQIADDGTNVSFAFSQDGANFLPLFTTAKASGFLGASGYNNVIVTVNPLGGRTIGTVMSWTQN